VVIADAKATTLLPILKERTVPDSIVYSDSLPSYNAPDMAGFRHPRINHARLFADGKNHINGIENFWNQAKRHLRKFNGVPKKHFPLCLKECEGRFNNPKPQTQLKQLNQWVQQSLTGLSRTAPRINVSVLPPPNPPNLRPKSGNGELSDDLGRSSTWGRIIGAVSLEDGERFAAFQYDPAFAQSGIEVSPITMPLGDRVYVFPDLPQTTFHGLSGLLADSLPDKFGNALIDAWLATQGRTPENFNVVERLCYTGARGMDALEFAPAIGPKPQQAKKIEINALVKLASEV